MKVTILVPVYGVEKYISECAHSLFSQTYPDIEYVFCDDCTPDASIDILKGVIAGYPERENHVRIIRNDGNKGLGGTRAHLTQYVRTDYFMLVDSDDFLPANAVETLVCRMRETNADVVEGSYQVTKGGQFLEVIKPCHDSREKYMTKQLCQNILFPTAAIKLYKRSILQLLPDMFIEGIDYAEDVCATCRVVAKTTRSWTDDVIYYYRKDNVSSYTKNVSERNVRSYLRCNHEIYRFYHRLGRLPLAAEIGILNGYRKNHRLTIPTGEVDGIVGYVPEHWSARMIYSLLCSHSSLMSFLGETLYRIERKLLTL